MSTLDIAARLTLVILLLKSTGVWYVQIPMVPLCVAGLGFSAVYRRWEYWATISAILAVAYFRNWFAIDNHDFLLGYWCLALAFSVAREDPAQWLAKNARLLVGLSFLFAVLWRAMSPDFLTGDFFHFLFLTNTRFTWLASVVGGLSAEALAGNQAAVATLVSDPSTIAPLTSSPTLPILAIVVTWWVFLLEATIAMAFLLPLTGQWSKTRDLAMLAFLFSTYAAASVVTFGWILAVMGFSQMDPRRQGFRIAYLVAFVWVWLGITPWGNLVAVFS